MQIQYLRGNKSQNQQIPENISLGIPLGSIGPVTLRPEAPAINGVWGELINTSRGRVPRYIAEGMAEPSTGKINPIYTKQARNMFAVEERLNGFGGFSQEIPQEPVNLVADASGSFLQARRVFVTDLIVRDMLTNQRFVISDVFMSSLCRNTINAFVTGRYYVL